jgi:hypothetical protein
LKEPTAGQRAASFAEALTKKTLDLGKGDFAQVVAELLIELEDKSAFTLPPPLEFAIRSAGIEPQEEDIQDAVP